MFETRLLANLGGSRAIHPVHLETACVWVGAAAKLGKKAVGVSPGRPSENICQSKSSICLLQLIRVGQYLERSIQCCRGVPYNISRDSPKLGSRLVLTIARGPSKSTSFELEALLRSA